MTGAPSNVAALLCVIFLCALHSAVFASPSDAKKPTDPTGMDLVRQTAGPELAKQLDGYTKWGECTKTPLSDILDLVAVDTGVKFNTDALPPPKEQGKSKRYAITAEFKDKPVQEVLKVILATADCQCTLEMGVLVIRPSAEK
jgi:hypothetical protein